MQTKGKVSTYVYDMYCKNVDMINLNRTNVAWNLKIVLLRRNVQLQRLFFIRLVVSLYLHVQMSSQLPQKYTILSYLQYCCELFSRPPSSNCLWYNLQRICRLNYFLLCFSNFWSVLPWSWAVKYLFWYWLYINKNSLL